MNRVKYLARRLEVCDGDEISAFPMVYIDADCFSGTDGIMILKNIVTCPFDKERAGYTYISLLQLGNDATGYRINNISF